MLNPSGFSLLDDEDQLTLDGGSSSSSSSTVEDVSTIITSTTPLVTGLAGLFVKGPAGGGDEPDKDGVGGPTTATAKTGGVPTWAILLGLGTAAFLFLRKK